MILKKLETPLFEISLFSDKISMLHRDRGERAVFTSSWLKFNMFEQKAYDSEGWTDGRLQYTMPDSAPVAVTMGNVETVDEAATEVVISWVDGTSHTYSVLWLWRTAMHPDPICELSRVPWKNLRDHEVYDFNRVMDKDHAHELFCCLKTYFTYGVVLIKGVPPGPESIRAFAEYVSRIETTQFEDIMELTVKDAPTNLAEVSGPVYLHNDIVFKQHPPAVQLLHVIRQADVGGENLFADGLHVVQQLSHEDQAVLRSTPVYFVNQSRGIHYRSSKPILVYDLVGNFQEIHYNKDKMMFSTDTPGPFYDTYRRLQAILKDPENCDPTYRVPENMLVMMDNLRLLHGRQAFTDTKRYYLSCYLCGDALKNRYRVLAEQQNSTQRGLS